MQAPYLTSRRRILQSGAIGYLGLCLPRLLRAEQSTAQSGAGPPPTRQSWSS